MKKLLIISIIMGVLFGAQLEMWEKIGVNKWNIKNWKEIGFTTPEQAKNWIKNGFNNPYNIKKWINVGIKNPEYAARLKKSNYSPELIEEIQKYKISIEDLLAHKLNGDLIWGIISFIHPNDKKEIKKSLKILKEKCANNECILANVVNLAKKIDGKLLGIIQIYKEQIPILIEFYSDSWFGGGVPDIYFDISNKNKRAYMILKSTGKKEKIEIDGDIYNIEVVEAIDYIK